MDDGEIEASNLSKDSDALPKGLTRELPSADNHEEAPASGHNTIVVDDVDLEELQRQLDALNAS
ncbi:hypothetical protein HPP92_006719 [Vanilla planifolia]|nr:hypothetical protein HPP92_006719 [Vanilla planifolia]